MGQEPLAPLPADSRAALLAARRTIGPSASSRLTNLPAIVRVEVRAGVRTAVEGAGHPRPASAAACAQSLLSSSSLFLHCVVVHDRGNGGVCCLLSAACCLPSAGTHHHHNNLHSTPPPLYRLPAPTPKPAMQPRQAGGRWRRASRARPATGTDVSVSGVAANLLAPALGTKPMMEACWDAGCWAAGPAGDAPTVDVVAPKHAARSTQHPSLSTTAPPELTADHSSLCPQTCPKPPRHRSAAVSSNAPSPSCPL
jgi:hypothetical protein